VTVTQVQSHGERNAIGPQNACLAFNHLAGNSEHQSLDLCMHFAVFDTRRGSLGFPDNQDKSPTESIAQGLFHGCQEPTKTLGIRDLSLESFDTGVLDDVLATIAGPNFLNNFAVAL
jgi:hypothetical protein